MSTVEQMIGFKGQKVHTTGPFATVFEAVRLMVEHNVGALVVVEKDVPCGMITERDYLRRIAVEGRSSRTTFVQEIMSKELISVDPDTTAENCMSMMTQLRIRHLPVLSGKSLVGIVSIGDIVKHLARERAATIDQLTDYIQGRA